MRELRLRDMWLLLREDESFVRAIAVLIRSQSKLETILFEGQIGHSRNSRILYDAIVRSAATASSGCTVHELEFHDVPLDDLDGLGEIILSSPLSPIRKLCLSYDKKYLWNDDEHTELEIADYCGVVRALATAIAQSPNLRSLALVGEKMIEGRIRESFYQSILSSQNIHELVFDTFSTNNRDVLGRYLPTMSALDTLSIYGFYYEFEEDDDDDIIICDALARMSPLTCLDLVNVSTEWFSLRWFASALPAHTPTLTTLKIEECHLEDEHVTLMLEHWPPNSPIQTLSLHGNFIEDNGVRSLMRAVAERFPTLQTLYLGQNESLSYEALRIVGNELANHPALTCVDVGHCVAFTAYDDPSLQRALERSRHQAGQALLHGVKDNTRITELTVKGNNLALDVVHEIGFYTSLNSIGWYSIFAHQGLSNTIWCWIMAKCQTKFSSDYYASLLYFFLREQPHLVQAVVRAPKARKRCKSGK